MLNLFKIFTKFTNLKLFLYFRVRKKNAVSFTHIRSILNNLHIKVASILCYRYKPLNKNYRNFKIESRK